VNTFSVNLYNIHGHCFRAVDGLPDSGIGAMSIKPGELHLLVRSKPVTVTAGRRASMKSQSPGGWPPGCWGNDFLRPSENVRSSERENVHFHRIGHIRSGSIEFTQRQPGRYAVEVSAAPRTTTNRQQRPKSTSSRHRPGRELGRSLPRAVAERLGPNKPGPRAGHRLQAGGER
jgi:hypothetical protein